LPLSQLARLDHPAEQHTMEVKDVFSCCLCLWSAVRLLTR
jgi:hypothetical protein